MRLVVVVVTTGAALAFIAASAMMNWTFMTSLGQSDFERNVLGMVSLAVSAFIALLPTLLMWACREQRWLYVAVGLPVFLVFAAFSMSSAVGFSAKNRGAISEDRGLATTRLAEARKQIEAEEEKKRGLGAPRPASVVEEAMRGMQQDQRWQSSKQCQDATLAASREFCKRYSDLKAEVARSGELAALEARIAGLRKEAHQYEERGGGRHSDNQAAVIGRFLGLSAVQVEEGLTVFLAALVEIGAALGLYFATGHIRIQSTPVPAFAVMPLKQPRPKGKRSAPKAVAGPGPRRVPQRKRNELVVYNPASKRSERRKEDVN